MAQKLYNFMSTSVLGLNLYRKHGTLEETVAKDKDKQLAKLWSNENV
jgi:hypothetical protein